MAKPLVSVVVTTRNSAGMLEKCLESVRTQTYAPIEVIVVDNHSTDDTREIAKRFTKHVITRGPERSAQRNLGAERARGSYLLIADSDMELSTGVVGACVRTLQAKLQAQAVIIPEESFGRGFWSKCKQLERSYYAGLDWIEAPRFFRTSAFREVKGYSQELIAGEDYDLSHRLDARYGDRSVLRVPNLIYHNEGRLTLRGTCRKKFYYAQSLELYKADPKNLPSYRKQASLLRRYGVFLSKPGRLFQHPLVGLGMLFMKTSEFAAAGVGYGLGKVRHRGSKRKPKPPDLKPLPKQLPIVTAIITTKNSASMLEPLLKSLRAQTYRPLEIIVVDNYSTDDTQVIAKRYADRVIIAGPERSAQRNLGVRQAKGKYVLILDYDMVLTKPVVAAAVRLAEGRPEVRAVTIPERSFGEGFWSQCKALERSFYSDIAWIEAPRFFDRRTFQAMKGYDPKLLAGGELYDLTNRIAERYGVQALGRVTAVIDHNEGRLNPWKTCRKKFHYGQRMTIYKSKPVNRGAYKLQSSLLKRYGFFLAHPKKLFRHPLTGLGMLFLKTSEFAAGGAGYVYGRFNKGARRG